MLTVSASAQTVEESKTLDNWYVGINGGLLSKTTGHAFFKDLTPNFGVRVGRYFTPVFGLAVEGTANFKNTGGYTNGTFVNSVNTSLLGTVNLSNWFGGYPGSPRFFEVSAIGGFGWTHAFGHPSDQTKDDNLTSQVGLDFAFNLGEAKAWQVYIEPAMIWALGGGKITSANNIKYNVDYSGIRLKVGVIYKFKNSNGTHNFKIAEIRDQAEIDALNAKINDLRTDLNSKDSQIADKNSQIAAKDRQISDLQKALDECNSKPKYEKPATATNLQPTVLFRQGKSVVDAAQYAPIELIAQYMKNHPDANVEIKGYASPEGSAELNQKLSEARAEAVKKILVNKYKISADRLTTKGCGATDKLFEQVEFNRVATFNDSTK
ncbi:MAG: OmpA family protein [Prevotellaceae bacterium]|nr:OmpA family protein [Prevotellaceae bacterium]